jgi:hypothetical protein
MPATYVGCEKITLSPYAYEKYGEILNAECEVVCVDEYGTETVEVDSDNYEMGKQFSCAFAGFCTSKEYDMLFPKLAGRIYHVGGLIVSEEYADKETFEQQLKNDLHDGVLIETVSDYTEEQIWDNIYREQFDELTNKYIEEVNSKKATITVDEDDILAIAAKIEQNQREDISFSNKLDDFVDGKLPVHEVILVGKTPNSLLVVGSQSDELIINQSTIQNCMNDESIKTKKHSEGHNLPMDILKQLPEAIRNPIAICNGSTANSVAVITELKNNNDKNVVVPIAIDIAKEGGTINRILTAYGKDTIQHTFNKGVLAVNIKKARELGWDIEDKPSQSASITCFDNSIPYSTANVKYPSETIHKNLEISKENSDTEAKENDNSKENKPPALNTHGKGR